MDNKFYELVKKFGKIIFWIFFVVCIFFIFQYANYEIGSPDFGTPYTKKVTDHQILNNCNGTNSSLVVTKGFENTYGKNVSFSIGGNAFFDKLFSSFDIETQLISQIGATINYSLIQHYAQSESSSYSTELFEAEGKAGNHYLEWLETRVRGEGIIRGILSREGTYNFDRILAIQYLGEKRIPISCEETPNSLDNETDRPVSFQDQPLIPIEDVLPVTSNQSFRPHTEISRGSGIFSSGTYSDGLAQYSYDELLQNNKFNIQKFRVEENPDGCGTSYYNVDKIWITGSYGMHFTLNDEDLGTYTAEATKHGYVFTQEIKPGDKLCAVNFGKDGYSIIFGPDMYYHYDSFCFRGYCY